MWAVGIGISVVIAAFVRFCPKQKLIAAVMKPCEIAGVTLSRLLALKLGKKAAVSIEEGVIATIAATIYSAVSSFMKGLLSDNHEVKK